jgi:AraC family transcriptional regulator
MAKASNRARAVRNILVRDQAGTFSLCFYPPGLRQDWHSHCEPSLALLLSGSISEQAGGDEQILGPGSVGLKPEDLRHCNRYGPDGAILLSLTLHDSELWPKLRGCRPARHGWSRPGNAARARALAAAAFEERMDCADLAAELMSISLDDRPRAAEPPAWISEVREKLSASPELRLGPLAAAAGVHRVHLCRSFSRWYGESVSQFRLRRKTEIALRNILYEGAPAASAAADGGFADQSHFSRTVRNLLGTTPGALRARRSQVTPVQDIFVPVLQAKQGQES